MDLLHITEISRAIQARHVAVSLISAETVGPEESTRDAVARLRALQFDFGPVMSGGRPIGVFRSDTPALGAGSRVADAMRPLNADLLVSSDTPYSHLVRVAREESFLFVVQGHKITGFITPNDLGTAPGRTHYYLLLAGLEMALAALIRFRFPDQTLAVSELSQGRQETHAGLVASLRAGDEFLDDVAAMSLVDLVKIAGAVPDFREHATSKGRGWGWLTDGLGAFRNNVMHPVRGFTKATGEDLAKLSEFDERLSTLMEAAEALMTSRAKESS